MRAVKTLLFPAEDLLGEHYPEFLNYLDRYEDAYGKYLLDTVDDLLNQEAEDEVKDEIINKGIDLVFERVGDFSRFKGIENMLPDKVLERSENERTKSNGDQI